MKKRAARNQTLTCTAKEYEDLTKELSRITASVSLKEVENTILCQDIFETVQYLPHNFVDLLLLDPPYNLSKEYHGYSFKEKDKDAYTQWFSELLSLLRPTLKQTSSIYVCSDWKTSIIIAPILEDYFTIQNRITWEREKGRGAKTNWKNNTEDIWFCTVSEEYTFNVDAVKLKRKVLAPYKDDNGEPKDWEESKKGKFRLTHPSNIWTDITIPFWSMPENTDHPTQKPEKLIAKLMMAGTNPNDVVFDPFLGSGTTAVVAKKLDRRFIGIERNKKYCCWAVKRLKRAEADESIQGYSEGVFWERNSLGDRRNKLKKKKACSSNQKVLFS